MKKEIMIGEIAKRLNIRLDHDDPAFVLVEMNRLMLEEATNKIDKSSLNATDILISKTNELITATDKTTSAIKEINLMARGIVIFAAEEQTKIQESQQKKQQENIDIFSQQLKKNTASFNTKLWLIIGITSINILTAWSVALFFLMQK